MRHTVKLAGAIVAIFATIGVGLGLSGYMTVDVVQKQFVEGTSTDTFARGIGQLLVAMVGLQTLSVTFFIGSVAAAVAGVFAGPRASSRVEGIVATSAGSFVGFFAMLLFAIVIIGMAFSDGGATSGQAGQGATSGPGATFENLAGVGKIAVMGIPTALVGAVSSGLAYRGSE